jgi:hypothetical protein
MNPVVSVNRSVGEMSVVESASCETSAIRKQPSTLTMSVP